MPSLTLDHVAVTYGSTPPVAALRSVTATIGQGEFVAIEGPSGGGKSTLLNVLGLLRAPTGGRYLVDGVDVGTLGPRDQARMRSSTFAFVFQNFYLLDRRRVIDSVELGMLYQGLPRAERRRRACEALRLVGLAASADRHAGTLSGGERQRVAIARALAARAPVVLADEPTGNLDSANGRAVIDALRTVHQQGVTVILVTHDPSVAAQAARRLRIHDGRRVDTSDAPGVDQVSQRLAADPRRGSSLRWMDLVRDAVVSVASRRNRSVALALAVAVATALAVTTFGLTASAAAQVASTFDAHDNSFVTATVAGTTVEQTSVGGWEPAGTAEQRRRTLELAGVRGALVVESLGTLTLGVAPWRPPGEGDVLRVGEGLGTAEPLIEWAPGESHTDESLPAGEALVGLHVAENLRLGPLAASPVVLVDGAPYVVAGIVEDGGRLPELTGSVVLGPGERLDLHVMQTAVLARAATGAAQQVASQIDLAVDPTQPDAVIVVAPVDPRTLRGEIESDLHLALLALTAATILASVVSLANSMAAAVQERRGELGLRRAVGAGARHVVALVVTESGIIATIGAVAGLAAGVYAVLAVTIVRRWVPVLDLRVIPFALVGGVLVGLIGGSIAAHRAAHIQPDQALRE